MVSVVTSHGHGTGVVVVGAVVVGLQGHGSSVVGVVSGVVTGVVEGVVAGVVEGVVSGVVTIGGVGEAGDVVVSTIVGGGVVTGMHSSGPSINSSSHSSLGRLPGCVGGSLYGVHCHL